MLSFILPAFRKENWLGLYSSLVETYHGDWEMIIVGPYEPYFKKPNLTWIEDWGCPTRCQQRGLLAAKGEWLCFGWDDGVYMNGAVDKSFEILKDNNFDYKTVVIGKFIEGLENQRYMVSDDYYKINFHDQARSPYFPDDFLIFSTGIISKKLLTEVGGFDCKFETMALSVLDLSIRLQFYGCKMILQEGIMLTCSWQPGTTGDHEPVHMGFHRNDMPLYYKTYKSPEFVQNLVMPLDNWEKSPSKWERRFQ